MHAMTSAPEQRHPVTAEGASGNTIRLAIVDDHALFREGLVRLLSTHDRFRLVAAEGTIEAAIVSLFAQPVDVLLLDYALGRGSTSAFVEDLRRRGFSGRILLVTAGLPDRQAVQMIRAGVSGIFHKHLAADELMRSIDEVFAGKVLLEAHYLRKLAEAATDDGVASLPFTARERQILGLLIEGWPNRRIASDLGISESATKAAIRVLFGKTGVRTRSQLVRIALELAARDACAIPS